MDETTKAFIRAVIATDREMTAVIEERQAHQYNTAMSAAHILDKIHDDLIGRTFNRTTDELKYGVWGAHQVWTGRRIAIQIITKATVRLDNAISRLEDKMLVY
jgi:hypothetical protein